MNRPNIKAVILAGGNGKRLWPISRLKLPKQCIEFKNNKTLLDITIDRILKLKNLEDIYIVTTNNQKDIINNIINSRKSKNINIIEEPLSRNTAPAMLMTILNIYCEDPESVLCFLPADHYITQDDLFCLDLEKAISYACDTDNIILLGISPHAPETRYGYIRYHNNKNNNKIYKVAEFLEKPNNIKALEYFNSPNMLWNMGIFCAKVKVFLSQFIEHASELFDLMVKYKKKLVSYEIFPDIPFDKAVLEKSKDILVIPASFKWSDIGTLESFVSAWQTENKNKQKLICHNAHNNIVENKDKLVVLVNVDNLCVIDTNDIIFIYSKSKSGEDLDLDDIKKNLKNIGYESYL